MPPPVIYLVHAHSVELTELVTDLKCPPKVANPCKPLRSLVLRSPLTEPSLNHKLCVGGDNDGYQWRSEPFW